MSILIRHLLTDWFVSFLFQIQPYNLAIELYVDMMRARGGQLPLPSGQNVTVNYVYINVASNANYAALHPSLNVPVFMLTPTLIPSTVFSTNSSVLLANYGISTPFTYVVPSLLTLDSFTIPSLNLIEDAQSHVVVHPFLSAKSDFVCDGKSVGSMTADCLAAPYNRFRRGGARRFQTLFSLLFDSTANQYAALDSFHTFGVKNVAILRESDNEFSTNAGTVAAAAAEQLNIKVLKDYVTVSRGDCKIGNVSRTDPICPPVHLGGLYSSQSHVFPNNKSAWDVARELKALGVEGLIILGSPRSGASWTFGRLFTALRDVGHTPKAISWGGSLDGWMQRWLDNPSDMVGTWTTRPWDEKLKGPQYKNYGSDTQFELLPADATRDGPQVFADKFDATYGMGSQPNGKNHPMWISNWRVSPTPAFAWGVMMLVQKMIEASMTSDVPTILNTARSISTPGVYHQIQFDQYGRTARVNEVLVQYTKQSSIIVSPYNIGSQPLFPLPTWEEREFKPVFYAETGERIMLAINSICILLCLLLTGFVLQNWKTPVIRAATPSFCLVIIFGGIMMLISNYFNTLVVNNAHCAVSTWFLTLGFQIVFCSLFIKTFRIWKIFHGKKLQVQKMKDSDLLVTLGVFVFIDIVINAVWQGAVGMNAREMVVDPERPAYNYMTCDFEDGIGAIATHLALKGGMLLFGTFLTYAVRNTPSQFNESTLIGISIYNVSFVVTFIIPIISAGLGGRHTVYLIRAYAIMFVVLTTLGLLYIPKMFAITDKNLVNNYTYNRSVVKSESDSNATHTPNATHTQQGRRAFGVDAPTSPNHQTIVKQVSGSRGATIAPVSQNGNSQGGTAGNPAEGTVYEANSPMANSRNNTEMAPVKYGDTSDEVNTPNEIVTED